MWRFVVVFALGCNQLYGLDRTIQVDAAVLRDQDKDGISDLEDNCIDKANGEQENIDADTAGDVCDNCPLLDSALFGDSDGDGIGDVCDPHPNNAGDCLIVVDDFRSAAEFAANWNVQIAGTANVVVQNGRVVYSGGGAESGAFITEVASRGLTDVFVRGVMLEDATVRAVSAATESKGEHYSCSLTPPDMFADGPSIGLTVVRPLIPPAPTGRDFVIRLILDTKVADAVDVYCRVDNGSSVGTDTRNFEPLVAGRAGIEVAATFARVEFDAIALSRFGQDTPCPPTIYR